MTVHPLTQFRERQTPHMTRAELARQIGVSRAAVTRWETFQRKPDEGLWPRIREVTGLKPSELVGFEHLEAAG